MLTRKWIRVLAWTAFVAGGALLALVAVFFGAALGLVRANQDVLQLLGLVIAPVLAIMSFFWGLFEKVETAEKSKRLEDQAEALGKAKAEAEAARASLAVKDAEVSAKSERIASLQRDLEIIANSSRLGELGSNVPFPEYHGWKYDPSGAKVVTVGLFKGGVGKTHLAANFAAYVAERQLKPVLLVDLDYQGSLSTVILTAAGIEPVGSSVDTLFDSDAELSTLMSKRVHLAGSGELTELNGGQGLSRGWIVPADYTLSQVESRLLVNRIVGGPSGLDERYRLAHVLLNPQVRRDYAMIIIDTPPRMTLGTVNALVASHALIVPTLLHRVSAEAIAPFLEQVELLKKDLDLRVRLAGLVAMMTRALIPSERENNVRSKVEADVASMLGARHGPAFVDQNIPVKAAITNSDDLGYFLTDSSGQRLRDEFYDRVFDELWQRIVESPEVT